MQKTKKKSLVFAGRLLVCIGSMLWILSGCGGNSSGGLTKFGESSVASSIQGEASDSSLKEEESEAFDVSDASLSADEKAKKTEESSDNGTAVAGGNNSNVIYVHLCGAVKEPGLYEVQSGSRLYEVLKRAGGLTEEACDTFLNQAQVLADGSQIYVPTKEEVAKGTVENNENSQIGNNSSGENSSGDEKDSSLNKVNINTADVDELMTLSGIGESKAKAIVEYRDSNGGFKSIEELMNISGIKEGVFQKIKDSITV